MDLSNKFNIVELKQDNKEIISFIREHKHKIVTVGAMYGAFKLGMSNYMFNVTKSVFNKPIETVNRFNNTFGLNIPTKYLIGGSIVVISAFIVSELLKKDEFKKKYGPLIEKIVLIGGIALMFLMVGD